MEVQRLHASENETVGDPMPAGEDAYAAVLLRHTDHVLRLFVGERLINKIFARVFQSHAMGRLVIAHFEWKAGAGPRPTLAWLQAKTGCTRTLAAFVGIACVARLLRAERDAEDGRRRFLVPGDRVVEGLRDWLRHHFLLAEALGVMPAGCARRLQEDADYFERYVRACTLVIDGLGADRHRFARWHWLDEHHCGQRIAYAYLRVHCLRAIESGACVHEPQWISLGAEAVARMLGISKSHVRNVVNGAERRGALEHDPSRRQLRLTRDFLAESRDFLTHLLILMAAAHRRASET
ncbi:MAG: hypothetical protein E6Q50_12365 [Lysobacter sp.]|nr:MAG: hypothetical protein E6Q50_12365 [Lysobacter sp.]